MCKRLGIAVLLVLALAGCAGTEMAISPDAPDPAATGSGASGEISFSADIQPLLEEEFAPLLTEDEGLRVDTWGDLMEGSEQGAVVIPFDAERSLLVQVAERAAAEDLAGAPEAAEVALVRRWIERGARNDAGEVPYADAEELLYVPNEGEALISIIDVENNVVVRTVDLTEMGFLPNAKPHDVVVEPDGSYWYVSLIGENVVLKFNRDNEIVGRVSTEVPGMMALDAYSERLYVGRSMSAVNPPHSIAIVDREAMTVEEVDVFYPRPHAIEVLPDGKRVYSASLAQNQLATIDAQSLEASLTSMGGPVHTLVELDAAPDGQTAVAGGQISGKLFFFDVSGTQLEVIDSLMLGGQPWHPTYTPDGRYVYVPQKATNSVSVVDTETRATDTVIRGEGLAQPHGSAVRTDGRYVYISNVNANGSYAPRYGLREHAEVGTVAVVDTQTREVVKVLEVGRHPKGLGL